MTTSAADESAPSAEQHPTESSGQSWTRGTAPYPPTGTFPSSYAGPHYSGAPYAGAPGHGGATYGGAASAGRPPSFDAPGYGYGYSAAPSWGSHLTGPKAWPVAVFTVFFGIFGAISAARRSNDARALGLPGGRYWGVFAGALVGSFAVWTLVLGLAIAVSVPAYLHATTTVMSTVELEQELEASNTVGGSVTHATCVEDAVGPTGSGTYECLISVSDGAALPYRITVSPDGSWAASATE